MNDDDLLAAIAVFGLQYAAYDWFEEQATDSMLMQRRGLIPGEPLPEHLGLFDAEGRLQTRQTRANLLKLREWLKHDDDILKFTFPEGLPTDEETVLREDLDILRKQPWSPQAGLDALLKDWPETETERVCTPAHAEQQLITAIDAFFHRLDQQEKAH